MRAENERRTDCFINFVDTREGNIIFRFIEGGHKFRLDTLEPIDF